MPGLVNRCGKRHLDSLCLPNGSGYAEAEFGGGRLLGEK